MPAANLTAIPDDMDWATAAAFPVAYGTSHADLSLAQMGEVLLVHGAGASA